MDNYLDKILDDRYEIQAVIGQGGMAVVYKANDRKLNRAVAIKILKPEIREDEELRRRFRAESEAVAQLNHPNIINVFDVSAGEELDYFVMELIDGITLKQYMNQRGVLTVKEAIHFTVQILKGLEHAHAKKIVHRDIKPQNVMILRDGTVKVTDFGIARVAGGQTIAQSNAFGTVHYIAPEQARCEETDGRADLYAAGVILYEMLTGQLPFQGESAVAVAMQHINSRARPPREINPDIPAALELIVMKAMNSDKNRRYRTAGEMIDDLDGFRRDPAGFMPAVESAGVVQELGDTVRFTPIPYHREETLPEETTTRRQNAERMARGKVPAGVATKNRLNMAPVLAGLLMLMLLAGACILLWITILSPSQSAADVLVPYVVGRRWEEVQKDKTLPRLVYEKTAEEYSAGVEAGMIIAQKEPEGKRVKEGSTLELTVSLGLQTEQMPGYTNWEYKDAEQDLRALLNNSVRISIVPEASATIERDIVIRTDPIAGQSVTAGQEVFFYVSGGPQVETVVMTNLLEKTEAEARNEIISLGLAIGEVKYEENESYPPGVVINQSTPANLQVPKNTVIHLVISKAPSETTADEQQTQSDNPPVTLPPVTVPWTTLLPQDAEYPAEYLVEIYQDGGLIHRETVAKSQGSLSLTITGRGAVTLEIFIDGSRWKTQTLPLE